MRVENGNRLLDFVELWSSSDDGVSNGWKNDSPLLNWWRCVFIIPIIFLHATLRK